MQLPAAKVAGRYRTRAVVVSGASPLRAVGFALAEAFGVATCEGLRFTLQREGHQQAIGAALKKVQAVQEPGDSISVTMEDLTIAVTLDAMKFTDDRGFDRITDRPMSRCVGGDLLSPQRIKRLNRAFLHNRKPVAATIDEMSKPTALLPGEPVVECFGLGKILARARRPWR